MTTFPTNFYVKAITPILEAPIQIDTFKNLDEEGNLIDYNTIPSYLAKQGATVELFSTDGFFLKAFNFDIKTLDEVRAKLAEYGLKEGESFFILSYAEHLEELKKDEWRNYEKVTT